MLQKRHFVITFLQKVCNGLTFRSSCESPRSDLARWTPGEIKKRGLYILRERNNNDLLKLTEHIYM